MFGTYCNNIYILTSNANFIFIQKNLEKITELLIKTDEKKGLKNRFEPMTHPHCSATHTDH